MESAFGIVAPFGGGWILDHLAQAVEGGSVLPLRRIVHRKGGTEAAVKEVLAAPSSEVGSIFAHHIPYHQTLLRAPHRQAQDVLFFGHYFEDHMHGDKPSLRALAPTLRRAARIWTNASAWDRWLIDLGVDPGRISRIVQVVDASRFDLRVIQDWRPRFTIGLVSQYHMRKNERFIIDAVERWPNADWVLLGRGWNDTPLGLQRRLSGAENFRFVDTAAVAFEDWPALFRTFDAFLSPSFCEGGPIPLLEAMAAGVWPIASRTGFAEDVIVHGRTGHVFDVDNDRDFDRCLIEAFERARPNAALVRQSVIHLSWDRFAEVAAADLLDLWVEAKASGAQIMGEVGLRRL